MQKRTPVSLATFGPMISAIGARLGKRPSPAFAELPAPTGKFRPPHPEECLDIPVRDQSPEDIACREAHERGQFLARQERWSDLAAEIRAADTSRSATPGGMPLADLMAYGARSDVIHAVEHALEDNRPADDAPLIEGIMGLEAVRREHGNDPVISLVVALAHIDIGWAWRGTGWDTIVPKLNRKRCAAHFDRADTLLQTLDGAEKSSPMVAAAHCAVLAGRRDPQNRIADDYEALIDLDPGNYRHMRALGNHLLPRWFGDYSQLELEARRTAARTQDTWGAGGYTWVCFDAIALDDRACARVDVDYFIDGLRDIVKARPDQGMINLLAAYCAVALRHGMGLNSEADLPRLRIAECARWLIRDHLRELHPMIWAHASDGFDNNSRVTSLSRFTARGRADALQVIADQFHEDIASGLRVTFTPDGPRLHSV